MVELKERMAVYWNRLRLKSQPNRIEIGKEASPRGSVFKAYLKRITGPPSDEKRSGGGLDEPWIHSLRKIEPVSLLHFKQMGGLSNPQKLRKHLERLGKRVFQAISVTVQTP